MGIEQGITDADIQRYAQTNRAAQQMMKEMDEKLQHVQRELYIRLVLQCSDMPDDYELAKLARFAYRASIVYGQAIGWSVKPKDLPELTKPTEHKMRAEAGKIVAGPT